MNFDKKYIKAAGNYLEEKYDKAFTFKHLGKDLWSDKTRTYIFTDSNANEVTVEVYKDDYRDNYGRVLYDEAKQAELQAIFGGDIKVYVSSIAAYFSENASFTSADEYFKNCPVVYVKVLAKQPMDFDEIADTLLKHNREENIYYSVVIYILEAQAYDHLHDYYDEIKPMSISAYGSFDINRNNEIPNKSWVNDDE